MYRNEITILWCFWEESRSLRFRKVSAKCAKGGAPARLFVKLVLGIWEKGHYRFILGFYAFEHGKHSMVFWNKPFVKLIFWVWERRDIIDSFWDSKHSMVFWERSRSLRFPKVCALLLDFLTTYFRSLGEKGHYRIILRKKSFSPFAQSVRAPARLFNNLVFGIWEKGHYRIIVNEKWVG